MVVGGVWPVSGGNFVEFWRIYADLDGFLGFSVVRGAAPGAGFREIPIVLHRDFAKSLLYLEGFREIPIVLLRDFAFYMFWLDFSGF